MSVAAQREVHVKLALMMFLQILIWGTWYVSITGWMNANGLGSYTAAVYSLCPIASIVSPLFLGTLADRLFASQRVMAVLHALGAVFMLFVPSAQDGRTLVLLLLGHALCYMPTLALANTVVFSHVSSAQNSFPLIRVFGTVGWIVGGVIVAFLPMSDASPGQFYLASGAGFVLAIFAMGLPHTPPPLAGQPVQLRTLLGADALHLLRDRSFLIFILCSFLICICLSGYYQQARNFLDFAQIPRPVLALSFGQMSEVLAMLAMPFAFRRLGVKWMLVIGMAAWVVRYGLFGVAAHDETWQTGAYVAILAGILLHGICYDFFFVTGQIYVDRVAPAAMRAQAQALLVLVTYGAGMLIGSMVFGRLADAFVSEGNWAALWLWPALGAALVSIAFVAFFREPARE